MKVFASITILAAVEAPTARAMLESSMAARFHEVFPAEVFNKREMDAEIQTAHSRRWINGAHSFQGRLEKMKTHFPNESYDNLLHACKGIKENFHDCCFDDVEKALETLMSTFRSCPTEKLATSLGSLRQTYGRDSVLSAAEQLVKLHRTMPADSMEKMCLDLRTLRGLDHALEIQLERTVHDLLRLLQYYPGTPMCDIVGSMQHIHSKFGAAHHALLFSEFVDNMIKVTPMQPVTILKATQDICQMQPYWPQANFRECIHAVAVVGAAFPSNVHNVPYPCASGANVVEAVSALCHATSKFSIANPTVASEGFWEIARTMEVTETLPVLQTEIFGVFDAVRGHLGAHVTFKHLVEATATLLHSFKSEYDNRASVFLQTLPGQMKMLYDACSNENPTYMATATALSHIGHSFQPVRLETCIQQVVVLKQCFPEAKLAQISDRLCHHVGRDINTAVMELKNSHLDAAFQSHHSNANAAAVKHASAGHVNAQVAPPQVHHPRAGYQQRHKANMHGRRGGKVPRATDVYYANHVPITVRIPKPVGNTADLILMILTCAAFIIVLMQVGPCIAAIMGTQWKPVTEAEQQRFAREARGGLAASNGTSYTYNSW